MPQGLRPLQGRARWAVATIAVVMVADVAAIWSDLLEIDLMNRLQEESDLLESGTLEGLTPVTDEDLESNDDRQLVVAAIYTVAYVAAIVFFIRWFHAAYSNLRVLGQPDIRFSPVWAIFGWFVPILNAWRPKQIANDIWRGSDPAAPSYSASAWKEVPVPPLLLAWWLAWLVSNYLSNLVLRTAFDADTVEGIETAAKVAIAASGVDLVAGALAIPVIWKLTARQEARAAARVALEVPPDTMSTA